MKEYFAIFAIVLIAGFLRFWHLTLVPPALNSDEVAIGYNAYSILKTGRDEYNSPYPLLFRSFDDYKMPVYVYLVTGSMKIFGFGDFAVRFPSALAGTLTVMFTYLLVKELFKKENIAIISALFLAISPWSIQFSRAGYEANVAVFFIVLGAYLFMKGFTRGWFFIASSIAFSITVWTYLTPRLFIPLLAVGLGIIYRKELLKKKYFVLAAVIVACIVLWPVARMSLSVSGQMRAAGVSAFNNPDDIRKSAERLERDKRSGFTPLTVFDNRRITYVLTFLRGYFQHFDPTYLFLDKSIGKYRAPDVGLLYLFELPMILTGMYTLIRKWSQESAFIFWWLLISPVAAAFTLQLPHPVRTLVFLPVFQIFSAVGLLAIWKQKAWIRTLLIICMAVNILFYLHQYFIVLPVEEAGSWYAGRKEMTEKIYRLKSSYDMVYVSNSLDFPYIFYLYYAQIDPSVYQKSGGTVSGGFNEQRNKVENISFRNISTSLRSADKKILFVGLPSEVFKLSMVADTIYYPDNSPAIVFFK